jgi:hypothetical protein
MMSDKLTFGFNDVCLAINIDHLEIRNIMSDIPFKSEWDNKITPLQRYNIVRFDQIV